MHVVMGVAYGFLGVIGELAVLAAALAVLLIAAGIAL